MSSLLTTLTLEEAFEKAGPEDEARDSQGKWTSGGSASGAKKIPYLYHGTSEKRLESIKREGLKTGFPSIPAYKVGQPKPLGFPPPPRKIREHVYVTTSPEAAWLHAYGAQRTDKSPAVVVAFDRNHPALKGFIKDPEYAALHEIRIKAGLPEPPRYHAFMLKTPIPPGAFHHVLRTDRKNLLSIVTTGKPLV